MSRTFRRLLLSQRHWPLRQLRHRCPLLHKRLPQLLPAALPQAAASQQRPHAALPQAAASQQPPHAALPTAAVQQQPPPTALQQPAAPQLVVKSKQLPQKPPLSERDSYAPNRFYEEFSGNGSRKQ